MNYLKFCINDWHNVTSQCRVGGYLEIARKLDSLRVPLVWASIRSPVENQIQPIRNATIAVVDGVLDKINLKEGN